MAYLKEITDPRHLVLLSKLATGEVDQGLAKEQKYKPNVLIGNWVEERRHYVPSVHHHQSMYRTQFKHPYPPQEPNYNLMWNSGIASQVNWKRLMEPRQSRQSR